jgi:hypothetical protein
MGIDVIVVRAARLQRKYRASAKGPKNSAAIGETTFGTPIG